MTPPSICVVIAARNAAQTIGAAIVSALREPQVAEVIVVDDASGDGTAAAARLADDGTGRLRVEHLETNLGPSAARNRAIGRSRAPFIAVLDADDAFLPGRFARLFALPEWDLAADNIVFVDPRASPAALPADAGADGPPIVVSAPSFIDANISPPHAERGELGFLKPVMRRAFLEDNALAYDERLRLGEDYVLYTRALLAGARFLITRSCGYAATVRAESLSGMHRTEDLEHLARADAEMLAARTPEPETRRALARHWRHVRDKHRLRRFLDVKRERGMPAAIAYALSPPSNLPPIAAGVVSDKWRARGRGKAPQPVGRYLLEPRATTKG